MRFRLLLVSLIVSTPSLAYTTPTQNEQDRAQVDAEHGDIGVDESTQSSDRNNHPDAQWWPEAGLGLFLHWGLSSVNEISLSWPMRPGRPLAIEPITDRQEIARIVAEKDYNLTGTPSITPNEYWAAASEFDASRYEPEKWMAAASEAGFQYVVLTAKHHEGFALWPSEYGDFSTKNYLGGRDLIRDYVDAARKYKLKVGIYYSGGDWWAEKEHFDFMYYKVPWVNPVFPALDADLNPRSSREISAADRRALHDTMRKLVRGQLKELLSNYGKIDILWFDGPPGGPDGPPADSVITIDEIRELQPGIVMNPRFFDVGDFKTHERRIHITEPETGWAEFCDAWADSWSFTRDPFDSNGNTFANYARSRSLNMNFLLGVGPDAHGELSEASYANMRELRLWRARHAESVSGDVTPLPPGESANTVATAHGKTRYLFAMPEFNGEGYRVEHMLPLEDVALTLTGIPQPVAVTLLSTGESLDHSYQGRQLTVRLPAIKRSNTVDVIKIAQ